MRTSRESPDNQGRHRVGTYFEGAADTFDTFYDEQRNSVIRWIDERFRHDVFVRYQMAFDALEPMEGATVLDVGCGSGPYLAEAVRRGAGHVVGLDLSQKMLELARTRLAQIPGGDAVDLVQGEFPSAAPDEVFDYAMVMGVMDYVKDAPAFLATLQAAVKQRAVLSFPSKHWFRTPFRKVRYMVKRCPVYFYERDQVRTLLKQAGFTDVTVTKISGAGQDYVAVGENAPS